MNAKKWVRWFILLFALTLAIIAALTAWLDPFLHYHGPLPSFSYRLDNERAQNDGILRQFDYDAVITGTSMTQNFKASEVNALFHCNAVKVCLSGATYRETASLLDRALQDGNVKIVVRDAMDVTSSFLADKDEVHPEFSSFSYLYNEQVADDAQYLLNRDVLAAYTLPMLLGKLRGEEGGITSFDEYSEWGSRVPAYGREALGDLSYLKNKEATGSFLSDGELKMLRENIEQNILRTAREHPETTFYIFVPPYSVLHWAQTDVEKHLAAEREALLMMLSCENIRVYSYSTDSSITCTLDNYMDKTHYGPWISSYILETMARDDGRYRITKDNLDAYIRALEELYLHYDYESLK